MSSAIEIRPPPPSPPPEEQPVASSSKPATGNKLCRNVLIYGFCKHEDDGCMFQHPPKGEGAQTLSSASSPAASPVVTRSALYTQAANAPAFVPKSVTATGSTNDSGAPSPKLTSPTFSAATPAFIPGGSLANSAAKPGALATEAFSQLSLNAPSFNPSGSQPATPAPILYDEMEAYYPRHPTVRQPLDYHLYTTPLPHITNLHPSQLQIHSFFLSPTLREDLQRRSAALQESSPIPIPGLPDELHVYHSLHPLEAGTVGTTGPGGAAMEKNKRVFGLGTEVYKGVCELDGNAYVLRRVENFKIMHDTAFAPIESWRRIRHPNVVSVREAFTTRLFGDHSVIFAYDYHPNSRTLFAEHFMPKPPAIGKNGRLQPQDMHIPEKVVWSYITQIANALKAIHSEGLAARMIDPSKILVTGRNRIRINCCGILDVVAYDGSQNALIQQQQEDLLSLGKLVLALTNLSVSAVQNLPKAMEILSRSYSAEIKNVVIFLLSKPGPMGKTVDELLAMLGARLLNELDAAQNYCDILESEMTRELENGRLVRLLCKFGFINERPEFDHDPRWSESGDRYILKLFRDMVFHQVDEHNKPVLDLSHVLTCLNKLDAGSDEKVMLMSRDEQSCLVVSYREIKGCVEAAFNDLARGTS